MLQFALLPRVSACLTSLAKEEKSEEIRKKKGLSNHLKEALFSLSSNPAEQKRLN